MKPIIPMLTLVLILSGACVPDKSALKVNINKKENLSLSVSSVQIINNQLIINGVGFTDVNNVNITGDSLNQNFSIASKSSTQVIANSVSAFSFDVSKVFNLLISSANASATFQIDFSLCNSKLNGIGFDCAATVATNDVLSYIGGKWTPRAMPLEILSGAGTANYVPYYTASETLADSPISITGANVGIGTLTPSSVLDVRSDSSANSPVDLITLTNNGAVGWGVGSSISFNGHNGVSTAPMGKITSNWDGGATNGNMIFQTGTGGSLTTRLYLQYNGNVGIGTTNPGSNTKLAVNGQIVAGSSSIVSGSVNFSSGNSVTTTFDCGTPLALANVRIGGNYIIIVTGSGTTQCDFSTTTTGDDAATVSYRFSPSNSVRTSTTHTMYNLTRVGNIVYITWITGF